MDIQTVNYIFGAPGSGKTTVLAFLCQWYKKHCKNYRRFSNFPLVDATLINDEDIGVYDFSRNEEEDHAVIFLDECGISYNNRDAANKTGLMKDPKRLRFWKLVRHYKTEIWVASQGWNDIDLKIRCLCTNMVLIRKFILPWWTVYKPIYKRVDIDDQTHEPADYYEFAPFFSRKLIFRPKYYKYFDSYDAPALPPYKAPL